MQVRRIACNNGSLKASPVPSSCACDPKTCNSANLPPMAASNKHCIYHTASLRPLCCILGAHVHMQRCRYSSMSTPVIGARRQNAHGDATGTLDTFQVCRCTAACCAAPARCKHAPARLHPHDSPENAERFHQATDCMPSTSARCRTETKPKDKPLTTYAVTKPTQVRPALTKLQRSLHKFRLHLQAHGCAAHTRLFGRQVYMHHHKHICSKPESAATAAAKPGPSSRTRCHTAQHRRLRVR